MACRDCMTSSLVGFPRMAMEKLRLAASLIELCKVFIQERVPAGKCYLATYIFLQEQSHGTGQGW